MKSSETIRYPIGEFVCPKKITERHITDWIHDLEVLPDKITNVVQGFTDKQLDTPYRAGGWTVRQVIHHLADSHHHSYTRFKWALTEENPRIKAYDENSWSLLTDAKTAPIELSLAYIKALHAKMVYLLKALSKEDLQKCYTHPEGNIAVSVAENIGKYAWHGNHHLAHIVALSKREKW